MQRSIPWFWILLALALLLLPGPAGRLFLDLLGGITLTLLALPLLAGGAALIGWQVLKRRLRTCSSCGASSFGSALCPACGTPFPDSGSAPPWPGGGGGGRELDPRNVTINVDAVEVNSAERKGVSDEEETGGAARLP
jgi:hypothetical protein